MPSLQRQSVRWSIAIAFVTSLSLLVGPNHLPLAAAPASAHAFCGNQITKAEWHPGPGGAPTLSVFPSACGIATAGANPKSAFSEAIAKGHATAPNGGQGVPNEASLYSQFVCHARLAVVVLILGKKSWNLDVARPNGSLALEVRHKCNIPIPPAATPPPASPGSSPAVFTYHVYGTCEDGHCGLRIHSGPGYSAAYPVVGTLNEGDAVNIVCQGTGESVGPSPRTGVSSAIWDKLDTGGWVSDLYINTPGDGSFTSGIPQC
jgi:hypothetical protein